VKNLAKRLAGKCGERKADGSRWLGVIDLDVPACHAVFMLRALSLSIDQMRDPVIIRVIAKSLLITLVLFALLGVGAYYGIAAALSSYGYGDAQGWIATLITIIAWLLAFVLLFRAVAVPVIGFFADEVVAAVEQKHYPAKSATARPARFGVSMTLAIMSVIRLLIVNILLLPVYIGLLLTAIGPFVLFLVANGILLGRDLGEMVAVRHLDAAATRTWLQTSRWSRAILGLVVSGLFMVPLLNIFAPIIGAAMATHLFHGEKQDV
jgi:CysZ protein